MPVLFQPSAGPVASIVNYYSSGGVASTFAINATDRTMLQEVAAGGAFTAGTLQTIVSHTGRGRLNMLTVHSTNATSRTLRCKVTVDGTVVFDATSSAVTTSNYGLIVNGSIDGSGQGAMQFQPIDYQESLLIEVASSLSEAAANVGIGVNRETWAS